MKTTHIVLLVVGASIVTLILSVFLSINMVLLKPENLAEVIKKDPAVTVEALQEAMKKYAETKKKQELEKRLAEPEDLETEGRVAFGPKDAPVTIVEFSDFQCPYCARASKRMKTAIKKYEGKVRVVYKHFPLSFHPFAKPAAEYFEAIAMIDHEKAKKFHDGIFDDFESYARVKGEAEIKKKLHALVKKQKIALKKIEENMEAAKKIVQADLDEGKEVGVQGTPSFYVNGVSARDIGLDTLIKKALAKKGGETGSKKDKKKDSKD